jgi:hypothetical protein
MLGPDMTIAPGPGGTHALDFALAPGEPDPDILRSAPFLPQTRGYFLLAPIVEQLTTFPIGSSSGGFLYGFDPDIGTFTRSSRSFGPSFGERPLTSGRGTLSIGYSAQSVEYDRLDGTRLDGGDIRFHFFHRDLFGTCPAQGVCNTPFTPERSDVMEASVRLRISSRTRLTMFTYGVTDRLDVGVTIPYVSTTLEAQVDKRILRLGTASNPTIHSFDGRGSDTATATGGGTASGLGDVRLQAKYNILRRRVLAVGTLFETRLPTGDSQNLLGTGTLSTRVLGVLSTGTRVFSPHGNIGVTFVKNQFPIVTFDESGYEITYTMGFDWSVIPRATVSADFLGRRRVQSGILMSPGSRFLPIPTATGPVEVQEFQFVGTGNPNLTQVVVGGKVGPWRTLLLVGNLLLPITDNGLRNKPALSFGVEYTF